MFSKFLVFSSPLFDAKQLLASLLSFENMSDNV